VARGAPATLRAGGPGSVRAYPEHRLAKRVANRSLAVLIESYDPVVNDTFVLDTAIHEPPLAASEVELMLFALARGRAQFAWKVGGLDAAGLTRRLAPSALTLGGLTKHMALVEDFYTSRDLTGAPLGAPWDAVGDDVWAWCWTSAADDSPEDLYLLWQGAVRRTQKALTARLADGGLEQRSHAVLDGESPNLRRVVIDLYEEYLRHTGHADLLREAVDGLVGNDPPQR
jgi:hypothetical protein